MAPKPSPETAPWLERTAARLQTYREILEDEAGFPAAQAPAREKGSGKPAWKGYHYVKTRPARSVEDEWGAAATSRVARDSEPRDAGLALWPDHCGEFFAKQTCHPSKRKAMRGSMCDTVVFRVLVVLVCKILFGFQTSHC